MFLLGRKGCFSETHMVIIKISKKMDKVKIKNKIRRIFPLVYNILKTFYHYTPTYKNKLRIMEKKIKINNRLKKEEVKKEIEIIKKISGNKLIVQNGNFKEMKYINKSSGSAFLPKILGSYEEPIQNWIEEVIKKQYKKILNIGCAEGYYAVGLGIKMPHTKIIAYDINKKARKNLERMIKLNNLQNIEIKSECTHEELNNASKRNTLIFCDIEGGEKELLNLTKIPNLRNVDLIIESHDCHIPNITEELINRFYNTHKIRIVVDYPYRIKNYKTQSKLTEKDYNYAIDEIRPPMMKFLYLEKICQ